MSEAINIFEQATKQKLRFTSVRGSLTVEDLWDLPLETGQVNLNALAIGVNRSLKESEGEESFVPSAKRDDAQDIARLRLQLDVLKHVINVKVVERNAKAQERARADQKQKLYRALEEAEAREIGAKSAAEIRAMIDAL